MNVHADADSRSLEIVQLQMQLAFADLIGKGLECVVQEAVDTIGGHVVLNWRLEDDPKFQRVAGVVVGEAPIRQVALIFLDHRGASVTVEAANTNAHPIAADVLARAGAEM